MGDLMRHCSAARLRLVWVVPVLSALLLPAAAGAAVRTGTLTVQVNGLPRGATPHAVLRGPGLRRVVRVDRLTLHRARAGRYTLRLLTITLSRASGKIRKGASAYPEGAGRVSVGLAARRTAKLSASYGAIVNPGLMALRSGAVIAAAGSAADPTAVTLSGRRTIKSGEVLSLPPSSMLPSGLLKRVVSAKFSSGRTTVTLGTVSVYTVVPVARFDIPLTMSAAGGAADQPLAHTASAQCGPTASGYAGVYRSVNNVRLLGGWNTVSVLGVRVPVGISLAADLDVVAGVRDDSGVALGVSCEIDLPFSGMAGPVPVTGAVFGNVHGSAGAGVSFGAGIGTHVHASVSTVGAPPVFVWAPQVSFSDPTVKMWAFAGVNVTAGFGAGVKFGLGNEALAAATVNLNNDLDFSAQARNCSVQAKFASFNAEGKLGIWTIASPRTPPLFTKTLWGPKYCEIPGGYATDASGHAGIAP